MTASLIPKTPSRIREETYEGWKNHPTWSVALFFDNDYPSYQAMIAHPHPFTRAAAKTFALRHWAKARREGFKINLSKVDWTEIADHWNRKGPKERF